MEVRLLLIISVLLQFSAAFLALRLISITGRRIAWTMIALAIFFMAIRRCISLYWLASGNPSQPLDLPFELVGLITSLFMVIGISLIKPLFYSIKKSEEALRDANFKLSVLSEEQRILIDHTLDMVYRHDTNGIFTFVSPAVEKITGYSIEEWLTHYSTYFTDNPVNKTVVDYTEEGLRTGENIPQYLVEIYHKTGNRIWLEINEQPYSEDGKIAGIIGVARDVTERKTLENEREKLIVELQDALASIKILRGFIPICAWCKKVRDDKGYWQQVEAYVREHSEAEFSHGICPECFKKVTEEELRQKS